MTQHGRQSRAMSVSQGEIFRYNWFRPILKMTEVECLQWICFVTPDYYQDSRFEKELFYLFLCFRSSDFNSVLLTTITPPDTIRISKNRARLSVILLSEASF